MELNKFVASKARPLPVIVMADTSGSMSIDGKIDALNQSIKDMISSFASESRLRAEIHLSIVTFGGEAVTHLPLTPAHQIEQIENFTALGRTPLGAACTIVKDLIEDKNSIPSRAYRPVIILASDGYPTDNYKNAFDALLNSERAQKATRFALSIGNDADNTLLESFGNDVEAPLLFAHNAAEIARFFRAVTMSVANHSKSQKPNEPMKLEFVNDELADDDLDIPL
ncbi:vWA domain-containing protein [Vibrio parahaemolyticus]|uniref:vWA domain-containing protein n=1 Tax=Vibrio harveyi group TaxID=717610 RepID=UPI0004075984|nr:MULTISPECIES: VWA domain-containing protein [Vibrio harveyi group]MBR9873300.1 VWA domain-containing protein [Vibrionaceae bacterium]EGQ8097230.1 VWA domain-containing protein [Vibrio parahaemolyticus]EGQ8450774.1 VWA domain-containing protein [Vibrio parahaemolyticus]EGQ9287040.1 VWA domain-containing protein [Vibrio parahaemolyticus]EGR1555942.1 VWA domain-containing protein [Vibrio parahaemolyticus]